MRSISRNAWLVSLLLLSVAWPVCGSYAGEPAGDSIKEQIQQLVGIIEKRNEEIKKLRQQMSENESHSAVLQITVQGAQQRIEELEKDKKIDRSNEVEPLKRLMPGDWARFKVTKTQAGKTEAFELRRSCVRVEETRITLIDEKLGIDKPESPEACVVLSTDFNPLQAPPGAEIEKLGEGQEPLKAAGREFGCRWARGRFRDGEKTIDRKAWFAKSAPLLGVLKIEETATDGATTVLELTEYGVRYDRALPKP